MRTLLQIPWKEPEFQDELDNHGLLGARFQVMELWPWDKAEIVVDRVPKTVSTEAASFLGVW